MSFLPIGEKEEEDTDVRSKQIEDSESIQNSANLLKSLKDIRVQNVCGSTAGAGSGTFHKYRQCKRREQFRLEQLKKEHRINKINQRIKKRKRENDEILEKKRKKKRKIRQRKKQRKKQKIEQLTKQNNNNNNNNNDDDEYKNNDDDDQQNNNDINKNNVDKQLEELLNIDQSLTNKQQINNDNNHKNKNEEQEEDQDDDLNQYHDKIIKPNENNGDNDKNNQELNKKESILAALAAEFDD